jgi:hypothetical protein
VTLDSEVRHELDISIGDYVVLCVYPLESMVTNGSKHEYQDILRALAERDDTAEVGQ